MAAASMNAIIILMLIKIVIIVEYLILSPEIIVMHKLPLLTTPAINRYRASDQ